MPNTSRLVSRCAQDALEDTRGTAASGACLTPTARLAPAALTSAGITAQPLCLAE
eukprot:CAMPEP_0181227730 /NCGR_PEP_ID=MMETSP1096-20121128/32950_1 /TAXON_ID=156174 ORGANISM="Chrysochromulina ericina, Strain CCMP281" /NCGR_SAMPLE_ID=MMETSP1096 /ASSEMBLY_ACC=CAM_ASM_000453 /LENGTH=54 /DNA_ID=CAMNT_0023321167 /DNA_START=174 /DNA_END=338 /DNA_ORIENTATION=+